MITIHLSENWTVRIGRERGLAAAAALLSAALRHDPDPTVRHVALTCLRCLSTNPVLVAAALPAALEALGDRDEDVRCEAAEFFSDLASQAREAADDEEEDDDEDDSAECERCDQDGEIENPAQTRAADAWIAALQRAMRRGLEQKDAEAEAHRMVPWPGGPAYIRCPDCGGTKRSAAARHGRHYADTSH